MSKESLTNAYRRGVISRREFIRGMVSLGVTVTAASRLADVAKAAPEDPVVTADDVYGNEVPEPVEVNALGVEEFLPDEIVLSRVTIGGLGGGSVPGSVRLAPGNLGGRPNRRLGRQVNARRGAVTPSGGGDAGDARPLSASGSEARGSRSLRSKLLGIGSAFTAATAFGVRRTKQQDELGETWSGWSDSQDITPRDEPIDLVLPEGEQ